ncbi:MAG: DUF2312 domain-containing protein [Holosporales bacterium]|jgi:uncharacterized protein (UPF0335 family)|nr:DUF2312 domain-containing protein [Holosporales bacterium]
MESEIGGIAADQLKSCIQKLETLEEEKATIGEAIREAFAEAKSEGFDPRILRKVLKLRKMKKEDVLEEEELTDLYMSALQS